MRNLRYRMAEVGAKENQSLTIKATFCMASCDAVS